MTEELTDDSTLKVIGHEYSGHIREALVIEFHLGRINALGSQDLLLTENRSAFKSALMTLESLLANYQDEKYNSDMKEIRDKGVDAAASEIKKSFIWYSILKRLISRTGIYKHSTPQLESDE